MQHFYTRWISIVALLQLAHSFESNLIDTFNSYWNYRWNEMLPGTCPGRIQIVEEDDTGLGQPFKMIEILDFPSNGGKICCHFHGSPIEASQDVMILDKRLTELANRYGKSNLFLFALEGWASQEYQEALLRHGFQHDARKAIMAVFNRPDTKAIDGLARELGPDFEARLIREDGEHWQQFLALRPPPVRHFMSTMDSKAIAHPENRYWCMIHLPSNRCVATAQIHSRGGLGNLAQVATDVSWRKKGLATALTVKAVQDAYENFPDLRILFGDASPLAIPMYSRLGAQTIGWINSYKG